VKEPFERIVAAHGDVVWRVCRGLLPEHDAEDAWSETFLAALHAWDRFEGDRVRGWLVTIAHRKAIDVTRRTARRAVPVAEPPEVSTKVDANLVGPDSELALALRDLPPKQKQAVAYHYLAGLPYSEVAAILGGSADAARRAAADGVAALRKGTTP
jgi:RNA polymerase sigma factor (sigma-70 family)